MYMDISHGHQDFTGLRPAMQSVQRMQQVIELGRGIRDQAKRPLKVPLRSLVVVHTDKSFLQDIAGVLQSIASMYVRTVPQPAAYQAQQRHIRHTIRNHNAGELREYVVEELNVRALETCDQPLQYAQLRAEPDWKVPCSCHWLHGEFLQTPCASITIVCICNLSGDWRAASQVAGQGHERSSGGDPVDEL